MAMAVDNRQQGHQLTGWGGETFRYGAQPHFTNPWVSAPAPSTSLYPSSMPTVTSTVDSTSQAHPGRPTGLTIPPFTAGLATTAAPLGAGIPLSAGLYDSQNLLDVSQGSFGSGYPSGTSPTTNSYAHTSAPQYPMEYTSRSPYGFHTDATRRSSHPSVPSAPLLDPALDSLRHRQSSLVDFDRLSTSTPSQRSSFSEALDASRGMVAMSQDLTPRNIYGNASGGGRNSTDSYGFPSTHSAHSSISSASTYPSYYNGSVADSSATDYSSASESVNEMNSRTLPRPTALVGASLPPAPQSMMGQFSSKVSSSSQKKHKCKICDKRFTRPSSLQTHMYSHTGEKPFACEVEGCGRHFSVVSNLRRHRKVHKGERDHPSPDDA